jgi:hypothetical protein
MEKQMNPIRWKRERSGEPDGPIFSFGIMHLTKAAGISRIWPSAPF